jgi:DNA-binding NarL/FixJ family response regulator
MHTLFIVDDHPAIRTAYRQFFESSAKISVVGEATNGNEALDKIPAREPDLALIDISMQEINGLELTRELKAVLPELKVLIVSNRNKSVWARKSLRAGANGYISKREFEENILAAIDQILQGGTFLQDSSRSSKKSRHSQIPEERIRRLLEHPQN